MLVIILTNCRLERKTVRRRRVFVTLKVLGQVVEELSKDIPEEVSTMIMVVISDVD